MAGTSLLDPNILRNDPALGDVDTGFWDQFGKGLKSSVTGTHAGLRGMSGTIGEMAGADEFAQSEFQRARELQAEAQAQGPRIGSYKDVGGLRDAVSYAGGILGGSAPSMALGMGAGMAARTALGGLAAGTLAQTPLEAADVAMKQLNDPGAMAQPAGERFARQIGGGAASAGLQTIIPNMVGGKLVGRGAEQAAKQSIKQIAGRNAMSIPAEGFFEGSSEGLKQMASNNENALNWDQIGENVVGGMVGGAPMAGAGFVGDTAGRVAPQAREAFGSARESINERLSRAKGAAGEQIDAAAATAPGKKIRSAYDDIADMVERGKGKFDDTVDKILKGEELGDPGEWLRATTDEAKKRMADFSDNERVKAATQWGKDMLSKLRPDDPRRGPVEAADPNTVDGQMLLASEKKKFDASEEADAKIDAMSEALGGDVTDVVDKNEAVQPSAAPQAKPTINQRKQFIDEAMASGMTQEQARTAFVESMNGPRMDYPVPPEVPKLSADYSGVQKVIADAIKDNGIVSRRPELFDTDRKIETISRNMRILLEQLPKGPLDEAVIKSVTRVFGDDTDSVINSLKRTLAVDLSPQESENFFGNLRLMKDINEGEKGLHDVMRSSLTDEARTRQQMTEKDAEALIKHARGQMGAERTAEKEHFDRLVDEYYKNNFGDKADTVRAAVEKAAGLDQGVAEDGTVKAVDDAPESEGGFDEGGSRIEAAAQDKVIYGLSAPDAKGNSKSELGGAAMLEGSRYAKQHELDLKAKFPDKDVYFERLPDSDYGHVVVEDRSNPGEFNAADLAAMKHDTEKYPNSPSRLSVGGHIIDAVKVAKVMRGKLQDRFEGDTPTTAVQRLVDGFKQGIAQLTEQFGEVVNVPDSAVIGFKAGNKPLTWGEAQRIRSDTAEDRMSLAGQAKLAELRKEYKTASAKDKAEILTEVRKLVDFERDRELVGDTDETAGARYAEKMNGTRIANVKGDRKQRFGDWPEPKEIKDGRYDAEGNLTTAGALDLLMGDADGGINVAAPSKALHELDRVGTSSGEGRSDVSADENPRLVAAVHGKKMKRGANMDGSAQYTSSGLSLAERDSRVELKAGIANWKDTGTAPALKIADRATKLLAAAHSMSEKDRTALYNLAGGTAAEASATVNALARKYKEQIVAGGVKGESVIFTKGEIPQNPVRFDKKGKALNAEPTPRISAEDRIAADNFEGLDSVAKVDDFLKSAYAAWENGSEDRDVQTYLNQMFDEGGYASTDLASFYDGLKGGNAELDHDGLLAVLKGEGTTDPKPQAPAKGAARSGDEGPRAVYGNDSIRRLMADNFPEGGVAHPDALQQREIDETLGGLHGALKAEFTKVGIVVAEMDGGMAAVAIPAAKSIAADLTQLDRDAFELGLSRGDRLKMLLSHEIGHVMDYSSKTGEMELSKAFAPEGPLFQEMLGTAGKSSLMNHLIDYVKRHLDEVQNYDQDYHGGTLEEYTEFTRVVAAGEAFANAVSLSQIRPEILNEHQPQAAKYIAKILAERDPKPNVGKTETGGVDSTVSNGPSTSKKLTPEAKKQAFLKRAAEGDKALLEELGASNDAKGLQRALDALNEHVFDGSARDDHIQAAFDVLTDRLSELVQDLDVAYGLQTRKYSLEAIGDGVAAHLAAAQIASISAAERAASSWKSLDEIYRQYPALGEFLTQVSERKSKFDDTRMDILEASGFFELEGEQVFGGGQHVDFEELTRLSGQAKHWELRQALLKDKLPTAALTGHINFDKSAADPNAINPKTERDAVKAHILKVLGPTVKVAWKNLTTMKHAGDYTHSLKLIRLSVHAINPMSTGYHESLHAFFGQLRDAGATDITKVLEKAASSQLVIDQLKQRYAGQPEVLNQLKDPEERAAYMYQMWASDPTFKIAINAKSVFGRIKAFIQRLAGAWTNDERALHIMEYFHSGEYAKNMGSPSAVRHALMDTHRSQILETAQSFAEPLGRLADAVVGTGGARLRDTGVPALVQLADIFKREHTSEGGDQGFIAASRIEGAKMRTQLGELLSPYTPEQLHDAMEALQSNTPAVSTEAQQAAKDIKKFLRAAHNYMTKAGVNIGDLGPDYFPRVWDTHYISKNQQAFRDMLEPYIRSGQMKGSADGLIRSLLAREGAEFGIESREPGMQHKKERLLDFITPQDSAQFVEKNLLATMSSYINQASRKAEWTRRLGGGKLEQLLTDAQSQGATTEQLDVAEDYMKGIDGTLGATGGPFEMTPTARRLMGNMIVYQNIRLLPMAAFSMLIDPMGVMVRGGSVGQAYTTFKRGIAGIKDTFAKDGGQSRADQATKWAELIGVVDSAMMTHAMSDIYSQGMVGGTAKKINNTFFKYNLVEGLNRNFRIGASEAAMKFMAHHADGLSGKGPSTHSVRWMKELGLQKGDIIVTPAGHLALTEQDGLSAAQVQRVHAAINQWVDGAVLRPDAADKPIWMNDPHYALISHLKQFVFSFQKTILARVAHEFRNGNYTPSMALASYVPIMIAADTAKGLLGNAGDTPEWKKGWTVADHVGYGVERAGLFGVGQFGLDIAQDLKRGGTGVGALTGPTIDQLGDMVSTLGGRRQFGTTVLDALPANTLLKGWSGKGEVKADPVTES